MPDQNQIEYGYDDPNYHEPEIPVPGLDGVIPIVDPGGNADGHIDYPDVEAPVSEAQVIKNSNAQYDYDIDFYRNDELWLTIGASNLEQCRCIIRAIVLTEIGVDRFLKLQYQVWSKHEQRWIDPSIDPVDMTRWPEDWPGMMNAELRIQGGLGDKV